MTNGIRLTPFLKAFCPQFSQAEGLVTDTWSEPLKLLGTSLAVSSHCYYSSKAPHSLLFLILPSLSPQGKNKNAKLVEEHVAFVTFSQMLFYFKKKKHTYCQVKLTVPGRDGQFKGGQLHFLPDLWAHLLGGCVNAFDTGQCLPWTSQHQHHGQLPVAQMASQAHLLTAPPTA